MAAGNPRFVAEPRGYTLIFAAIGVLRLALAQDGISSSINRTESPGYPVCPYTNSEMDLTPVAF
jgi:hypothetical protein